MKYTALYRKFRPSRFDEVHGQDAIVTTLKNQITADRIGHAYLFGGTRGTGKTSVAKIFARAVNCEKPENGSPCGVCPLCRAIAADASMNVIEIDAASNNGVDNIRAINEEVAYSPVEGNYKVYIIDEVHMLSIGAFNALLKTLEEPPPHVIFILATTDVHKVPQTILSRCQRYDFKRITVPIIIGRLEEMIAAESLTVEATALRFIARTADGSMRDAISLLDQCVSFYLGETLTYERVLALLGVVDSETLSRLYNACTNGDVKSTIAIVDEVVMNGRELYQFIIDFTWYLRNILLLQAAEGNTEIIDASAEDMAQLLNEAKSAESGVIMRYIRICSELSNQIRFAISRRVMVETALIKLCKPEMETDSQSLLDRIRVLEERANSGTIDSLGQRSGVTKPPTSPYDPQLLPKEMNLPTHEATTPEAEEITDTQTTSEPSPPTPADEDIAANWAKAMTRIDKMIRPCFKNAAIRIETDGQLLVMIEDGIQYDNISNNPEYPKQLERILTELCRKEVTVEIRKTYGNMRGEDKVVAATNSDTAMNPDITKDIQNKIDTDTTPNNDTIHDFAGVISIPVKVEDEDIF
ncbi:MAG: DNA polymerase III subunit gamma/tau [Lachnospiraceae bacterium]|jgi:DNA polymerase-3 subunit gamma/tau|nr:DNA polymerase III subunit gamma/tau [Lachnospiraceae bacterium]